MARARNIKPSIFRNEVLGTLDPLITLLFVSLWCLADRDGKLEDRPLRIKADTFPYRENIDINGYLTVLAQHGFIRRYLVDGVAVIQVTKFREHQSPHKTERDSVLPDADLQVVENKQEIDLTVNAPLKDDGLTAALPPESLLLNPDSLIPDSLNHESGSSASAEVSDKPKTVFVLPDWIDAKHWAVWHSCPKRKKANNDQKQMAVDKLAAWRAQGFDHAGALENAAIGGNQGLFLPNRPSAQGFKATTNHHKYAAASAAIFDEPLGEVIDV